MSGAAKILLRIRATLQCWFYVQSVPQLMSQPKITRHSENRDWVSHSIFAYPSLNVSDAASKRPSMPDNRVASGTKLIPIHLFGCSKLGRH